MIACEIMRILSCLQEFEMDPEIKKELDRQTQEKIDTVKKELAWDSEKQQIALDKLKIRYNFCLWVWSVCKNSVRLGKDC